MTSEFFIHELNSAIRQLKARQPQGRMAFPMRWSATFKVWPNRYFWTYNNQFWNTRKFPTSWKEAIITLIIKKGKHRHSKTSYHLTSLLSCLGNHGAHSKPMSPAPPWKEWASLPSQTGFRKNRSTEDQVTLLTQDIKNGFQQKLKTLVILLTSPSSLTKCGRRVFSSKQDMLVDSELFLPWSAGVKLEAHTCSSVKSDESHKVDSSHQLFSSFSLMATVASCPPTSHETACRCGPQQNKWPPQPSGCKKQWTSSQTGPKSGR